MSSYNTNPKGPSQNRGTPINSSQAVSGNYLGYQNRGRPESRQLNSHVGFNSNRGHSGFRANRPRFENPRPVNPQYVNPRPVNPQYVNPRPVNPRPVNPRPVNPRPVNPQYVNPRPNHSNWQPNYQRFPQTNYRMSNPGLANNWRYANDPSAEEVKRMIETANNKMLIIMRGLPGSGKTTLAKQLISNSEGIILSADQYFINDDGLYNYDATKLTDAHECCQNNCQLNINRNVSPIIIDNTNLQMWQMESYLRMGHASGYKVLTLEPENSWIRDVSQLHRLNSHGVPIEKIQKMAETFENVTVEYMMKQFNLYPIQTLPKDDDPSDDGSWTVHTSRKSNRYRNNY